MFTITLDEALKSTRAKRVTPKRSAPPLRELGPIRVREANGCQGRSIWPYVTDGETNASLRKGDDVMSISDERASELLATGGPGSGEAAGQEDGGPQGAGQKNRGEKAAKRVRADRA